MEGHSDEKDPSGRLLGHRKASDKTKDPREKTPIIYKNKKKSEFLVSRKLQITHISPDQVQNQAPSDSSQELLIPDSSNSHTHQTKVLVMTPARAALTKMTKVFKASPSEQPESSHERQLEQLPHKLSSKHVLSA